jgi:hypothetical protein
MLIVPEVLRAVGLLCRRITESHEAWLIIAAFWFRIGVVLSLPIRLVGSENRLLLRKGGRGKSTALESRVKLKKAIKMSGKVAERKQRVNIP